MIRLSPGILASSHTLLKRIFEYEQLDIFTQILKHSNIDGTKTVDVIDTMKACGWVDVSENQVTLSTCGLRYAKSFDIDAKRDMISDYIRQSSDSWKTLIPRGRKESSSYIPTDVLSCLQNAGLLKSPVSDDVVLWWDQQAQIVRHEQTLTNLGVGRLGEKLTIDYERKRTGKEPIWKAIESNLAGYDVLSVLDKDCSERLSIEVKTSEKRIESAKAFITRYEWEVSKTATNHTFHFWLVGSDANSIAILSSDIIKNHIPVDTGFGKWNDVEVPFKIFKDNFHCIPN
jgi:hypothetical protein